MRSLTILGLACVDPWFRNELFNNTVQTLDRYPDLSWSEREGLMRLAQPTNRDQVLPRMQQVGDAIAAMPCPETPCPWPRSYLAQKP